MFAAVHCTIFFWKGENSKPKCSRFPRGPYDLPSLRVLIWSTAASVYSFPQRVPPIQPESGWLPPERSRHYWTSGLYFVQQNPACRVHRWVRTIDELSLPAVWTGEAASSLVPAWFLHVLQSKRMNLFRNMILPCTSRGPSRTMSIGHTLFSEAAGTSLPHNSDRGVLHTTRRCDFH